MPTIFTPEPVHSCLTDNSFDIDLNKDSSKRVVGEIWACPDCGRRWIWDGDERATVPHPHWSYISLKQSARIIQRSQS